MGLFDYFKKKKREKERLRFEEEARIMEQERQREREEYARQQEIRKKENEAWLEENHKKAVARNARLAALRERMKEATKEIDEENERRRKAQEQRIQEHEQILAAEKKRKEESRKKEEERKRIEESRKKKKKEEIRKIAIVYKIKIVVKEEPVETSYYNLEDIKVMKMGDFMICPYDAGWYFQVPDAKILTKFANTDKIRRFLPGLDFSTEKKSKKTLESLFLRAELDMGFTHVIRYNNFPIGMISINSPSYNKMFMHLHVWSIDLFIVDMFEHKGIMYNALLKVLNQLKGMGAQYIYAFVDATNTSSLKLLGNGLFQEVDNCLGVNPRIFMIDLKKTRFERR